MTDAQKRMTFDDCVKAAEEYVAETISLREYQSRAQKQNSALDAKAAIDVLVDKLRPLFDEQQARLERRRGIMKRLRLLVKEKQATIAERDKETRSLRTLLRVYGRHNDDCLSSIGVDCSCGWLTVEIALAEKKEDTNHD